MTTIQDRMLEPSQALIHDMAHVEGDIVVLGAGGKLGFSLVALAVRSRRAARSKGRVIAVSRFSDSGVVDALRHEGADVHTADLEDEDDLRDLPSAPNVVYLVGTKFGTAGNEEQTWATNTYLPGRIGDRYRGARTVLLSSGNVYGFAAPEMAPNEQVAPSPVGEYAMSCLGRERVFTYQALRHSSPSAILRLNYAVEMRYGILVDLASAILADRPISLSTPLVNLVWQGFANEVILRSLRHTEVPPFVLNLTGPEALSVRDLAHSLAAALGRSVDFVDTPNATSLLADATNCAQIFGTSPVDLDELIEATATWMTSGGAILDRPTKFQRRDGRF